MLVFVYLNGLLVVSELTHSMQDFKLNILARSILTWTALWSLVKDSTDIRSIGCLVRIR